MRTQSRKFHFKNRFVPLQKFIEKCLKAFEFIGKVSKKKAHDAYSRETDLFSSTATAMYAISVASVLISFFWLTLLLTPSA